MATSIGIAGAGVLGRLLAWRLAQAGHDVQVFDPAPGPEARHDGRGAAGFTAAGMLSPLAESECGEPEIVALGLRSLPMWEHIAQALRQHIGDIPAVQRRDSLLLAHPGDRGAAQRVLARLGAVLTPGLPAPRPLTAEELPPLEPSVAPRLAAWWLEGEGQLLPATLLPALCESATRVRWHWDQRVATLNPGRLHLASGQEHAVDWAIDARGLGAADALPLRGVRGELIWLHAPGVALNRPLRLLHPRHRVYLVPRPGDIIVVGATEIESEDRSGVSLASAVELLSAAQSVIPALAEARIVHLETNLRPALPDNRPCVVHEPGLLRINGLYRHGWLLAPALVEDALGAAGLLA